MRPGASVQFHTGVLIFEESDFPIDEDKVVSKAREYEATKPDPDAEGDLFIVRFPDGHDECYTEQALRRSIRWANKHLCH